MQTTTQPRRPIGRGVSTRDPRRAAKQTTCSVDERPSRAPRDVVEPGRRCRGCGGSSVTVWPWAWTRGYSPSSHAARFDARFAHHKRIAREGFMRDGIPTRGHAWAAKGRDGRAKPKPARRNLPDARRNEPGGAWRILRPSLGAIGGRHGASLRLRVRGLSVDVDRCLDPREGRRAIFLEPCSVAVALAANRAFFSSRSSWATAPRRQVPMPPIRIEARCDIPKKESGTLGSCARRHTIRAAHCGRAMALERPMRTSGLEQPRRCRVCFTRDGCSGPLEACDADRLHEQ